MKYIKLFEYFESRSDIYRFCSDFGIENYIINDDLSIDVNDDVDLRGPGLPYLLTEFPVKFRKVSGKFWCMRNNLTTLKGSPIEVGGDFNCGQNNLSTLEGAPRKVGGRFECELCNLKSLEGAPISVGIDFICSRNLLTSLIGTPKSINRRFDCSDNHLTSLDGAPSSVGDLFDCGANTLYSFEYFPDYIGGKFRLPRDLEYIFSLFENSIEYIYLFQDYNIIKAPKNIGDKPRLKLSNLNSFLTDNGFKELDDTTELSKYYDLK